MDAAFIASSLKRFVLFLLISVQSSHYLLEERKLASLIATEINCEKKHYVDIMPTILLFLSYVSIHENKQLEWEKKSKFYFSTLLYYLQLYTVRQKPRKFIKKNNKTFLGKILNSKPCMEIISAPFPTTFPPIFMLFRQSKCNTEAETHRL